MTVEELQARLRALHGGIGFDGCLSLTLDQEPDGACYASHWFRPARYQPERWHQVGVGTLPECLAALERYADGHHHRPRHWSQPRPVRADDEIELVAAE